MVDASVFPRIPGFFIASAVYMVGEKAADVILEDAQAFRATTITANATAYAGTRERPHARQKEIRAATHRDEVSASRRCAD